MIPGTHTCQPHIDRTTQPSKLSLPSPSSHFINRRRTVRSRCLKSLHLTVASSFNTSCQCGRIQAARARAWGGQSSVVFSWTIHNSIQVARLKSGKACWRYVNSAQQLPRRSRVCAHSVAAFTDSHYVQPEAGSPPAASSESSRRHAPQTAPQASAPSHSQLPLVARQAGSISMVGFVQAWQQLARHFSPRMKGASNTDLILRALKFAMSMLQGSPVLADGGTPLQRALAVAGNVADLSGSGGVAELGAEAVAACLAAAVLEQQPDALEAVENTLGPDVALLAHQVQRVRQCPEMVELYDDENASLVRETCLAFYDVRAVVVELLWRWHGLQNMRHLPQHEQQLRAMEALQIYTPLGHGLGLGAVSMQMEDRCLEVLFPGYYKQTSSWLRRIRGICEATLHHCQEQLLAAVRADHSFQRLAGGCVLRARTKSSFSLMKKMLRVGGSHQKGRRRQEVFDLLGLRVVVQLRADMNAAEAEQAAKEACYIVQDIAHRLWPSLEGRSKDYIHKPKSNGYQSLHTTLVLDPITTISTEPSGRPAASSTDEDPTDSPLQIRSPDHTPSRPNPLQEPATASTDQDPMDSLLQNRSAAHITHSLTDQPATSSTDEDPMDSPLQIRSVAHVASSPSERVVVVGEQSEVRSMMSGSYDSMHEDGEDWPHHLELQIRTEAMDRQAEQGGAAHNAYKGGLDLWQAQQLHGWARELQWHVEREGEHGQKVSSLETELEAGARALFDHMDRNGDGMIQAAELEVLLQELGADAHSQRASAMEVLDAVDSNHDLLISFDEFLELHRQVQHWKEEDSSSLPCSSDAATPATSISPASSVASAVPQAVERTRLSSAASGARLQTGSSPRAAPHCTAATSEGVHQVTHPTSTTSFPAPATTTTTAHPSASPSHPHSVSSEQHPSAFRASHQHTTTPMDNTSHMSSTTPSGSATNSFRSPSASATSSLHVSSNAFHPTHPASCNRSFPNSNPRQQQSTFAQHNPRLALAPWALTHDWPSQSLHTSRTRHSCSYHSTARKAITVRAMSWDRNCNPRQHPTAGWSIGSAVRAHCGCVYDRKLAGRRLRGAVRVLSQGGSAESRFGSVMGRRIQGVFRVVNPGVRASSSLGSVVSSAVSNSGRCMKRTCGVGSGLRRGGWNARPGVAVRSLREGEALVADIEIDGGVDGLAEQETTTTGLQEPEREIPIAREQLETLEASLPPAESPPTIGADGTSPPQTVSSDVNTSFVEEDYEEIRPSNRAGVTGPPRKLSIAEMAAMSAMPSSEEAWELWEGGSPATNGTRARVEGSDADEEQVEEIRPMRRLQPAPERLLNGVSRNGMTSTSGREDSAGVGGTASGDRSDWSGSDEEDDYNNGTYRPLISKDEMGQDDDDDDDDQPGPSSQDVPLLSLVPANAEQLSLLDPQHNLRAFIPGITIPKQGPLIISNSLQHFSGTDALVDFQTPAYDRLSIRLEFIRHRWTGAPSLVLQNCSRRNRRRTTAGIFVNGRRVLVQGSVWLYPGDVVSFGAKGSDFSVSVDPCGAHSPILQTIQAFCSSQLTDSTIEEQLQSVLQGGGPGSTSFKSKPGPEVDKALLRLYLKSPADATDLLQKLAVQCPEHSGVWYTWALLALKQRNWSLARTMHRTARAAAWSTATRHAASPLRALPAKLLQIQGSWARMEWNLRNYASARRLYRSAIDIALEGASPIDVTSSARLLHQWASLESDANNVRNARVLLSEAMRRFPTDAAFYVLGGSVEMKAGNMDLARMFLVRAYQLSQGGNERVYTMLPKAEIALGYIDDARALLQEGMRLFPRNVSLYNIAASLELDQGDSDLAMTLLEQGLAVDGESESAMHCRMTLAKIHAGQGNMEVVRQLLREGLDLHPKHVPALVLWASLERKAGFLNQAETLARKAQKVSHSTNEHVAGELASIYAAKGEAALSANLMRHVSNLRELHMHKAVGVPAPVAHERFFAQQRGKKERHIIRKAFRRKVELGWVQPRKKFDFSDGAWVPIGEDSGQDLPGDEDDEGGDNEDEGGDNGNGAWQNGDVGSGEGSSPDQAIGQDVRLAMEQLWSNGRT